MKKDIVLSDKTITLETGRYAQQATAAVLARVGDTIVHATVVVGKDNPENTYLPLFVEYQEKLYAGGKIKGSRWMKREGRPSEDSVLTSRLIDRSIRPLFPKSLRREIQIIVTTLSVDGENDPDMPAIIAASTAISLCGLPFAGPAGAVRVGYVGEAGKETFVTNPTHKERAQSNLDLVVSGSQKGILMVEAGANQVSEKITLDALKYGQKEIEKVIATIAEFVKESKVTLIAAPQDKEKEIYALAKKLFKTYPTEIKDALETMAVKEGGNAHIDVLAAAIAEKEALEDKVLVSEAIVKAIAMAMREKIITKGIRADGRKTDEIRKITCRVAELPRTHGSAMFLRGTTQALTIVTLASPSAKLYLESPESEETKRYIHQYNMPPFSVGETGRVGYPSRREIGHGALAERALLPVIPSELEFPYTIQVVSEIMSSNGSTSMASTCGSTLSLMDAGVPIKSPVAGIAMGLIIEKEKTVILSDIMGIEDFYGDMDFKVAGTKDGITALQMDVKVPGLSFEILEKALNQAHEGRLFILDKMLAVQPKPNANVSKYAPKINIVKIDVEKIGAVIGPGGKMIKKISAETKTVVDVEDDGSVSISGVDQEMVNKATEWVKGLVADVEVGQEYDGKVVRIVPFGAFVNVLPGKDGLIHISKLADGFLASPTDVVNEGDAIRVRVNEVDEQGRVNLVPVTPFTAPAGAAGAPAPRSDMPRSFGGDRPSSGGSFHRRSSFGDRSGGSRDSRGGDRRDSRSGDRPFRPARKPYYDRSR